MIAKYEEPTLGREVFTDHRLKGQQGRYCLCTRCTKTPIYKGETVICDKHNKYMALCFELGVAAPVFGCVDFEEREGQGDVLMVGIKNSLDKNTNGEIIGVINVLSSFLMRRFNDNNENSV